MGNSIKKVTNEFTIKEENDGVIYTINKQDEKIVVYDEELVRNIIEKAFTSKYKKLLAYIMNDEDDTSDNEEYILSKIDDLKRIIYNKYLKYLDERTINKYFRMLELLEDKVRNKTKHKSR